MGRIRSKESAAAGGVAATMSPPRVGLPRGGHSRGGLTLWWLMLFAVITIVALASYLTVHKMDVFCQMVFVGNDDMAAARTSPLLGGAHHVDGLAIHWHPIGYYRHKEVAVPEAAGTDAAGAVEVTAAAVPSERVRQPVGMALRPDDSGGGATGTRRPYGCTKLRSHYEWKSCPELPRKLSRVEHWKMLHLMDVVDWLLGIGNFTYIMYGGTLLGSLLFHDLIPWDEDIDILVPQADKKRLVELLTDYGKPEYRVSHLYKYSKFFSTSGFKASTSYNWTWPYLDIGYYGENSTHIWEVYRPTDATRTFPKWAVFPLHLRPLAGHWFPAPRDSYHFMKIMLSGKDKKGRLLANKLPEFKCREDGWDHRNEAFRKTKKSTDCKNVLPFYPVVHSRRPGTNGSAGAASGLWEVLTLNENITLQECFVDEPSYAAHGPLSFDIIKTSTVQTHSTDNKGTTRNHTPTAAKPTTVKVTQ